MSRYTEIKAFVTQLNEELKADPNVDDYARRDAINLALQENFNMTLQDYTKFYQVEQESKAGAFEDPVEFLFNSLRQGFQGATLGFGDEIEAVARKRLATLIDVYDDKDKAYEELVREIQAGIEGFEQANPKWSFGAEIIGGFAIPYLGTATNIVRKGVGTTIKYAPKVLKQAPKARPKTTELITQTTVGGGLGAGYEKGKTGDVSATGVGLGGTFGAGGYYAGQGGRILLDKVPEHLPIVGPLANKVKGYLGSGEPPPEEPIIDDWIGNRMRNEVTVTGQPQKLSEKRKAMRMFLQKLGDEELTIDDLLQRFSDYRKANKLEDTTIYDLASEMGEETGEAFMEGGPLQSLLSGARLESKKTAGILGKQYKHRQLFSKERALTDLKNLFSGITKGMRTKYASIDGFKEEMKKATQALTKPWYEKVEPIPIDDANLVQKIRNFINGGEDTIKAVGTAQRDYARNNRNVKGKSEEMPKDPSGWNIEMLDAYKKAVDDIASGYFEAQEKSSGKALNNALQTLLDDVDVFLTPRFVNDPKFKGTNPYKKAREEYVSEGQAEGAYQLGLQQMSNPNKTPMSLEDFKHKFDGLPNDRAKRYTILGLYESLLDAVRRIPTRKAPDVRFVTQGGAPPMEAQEKIRYALANIDLTKKGRESINKKLSTFEKAQAVENNFLTNFNTLIRGSRTAEKLSDQANFRGNAGEFAEASVELATTGMVPLSTAKRNVADSYSKRELRRLEKLADSLSDMMLKKGEGPMKLQLEELRDFQRHMNMGPSQGFRGAFQNPLAYSLLDRK